MKFSEVVVYQFPSPPNRSIDRSRSGERDRDGSENEGGGGGDRGGRAVGAGDGGVSECALRSLPHPGARRLRGLPVAAALLRARDAPPRQALFAAPPRPASGLRTDFPLQAPLHPLPRRLRRPLRPPRRPPPRGRLRRVRPRGGALADRGQEQGK